MAFCNCGEFIAAKVGNSFCNFVHFYFTTNTQETNNVALVARRHEIAPSTIYTWIRKKRQTGSVVPLPKAKEARYRTMERQLKEVSTENDRLKRLIAEKELELSILRELRDLANPR
jgi:transposase